MPVRIQTPRAWAADDTWSKYKLETKPGETWTRTIAVSGSPIDLEGLSAETVQAHIVLTEQDKQRGLESWWPGKVSVQFPDPRKFQLAEPVPPVNYRLVKRAETAAVPS